MQWYKIILCLLLSLICFPMIILIWFCWIERSRSYRSTAVPNIEGTEHRQFQDQGVRPCQGPDHPPALRTPAPRLPLLTPGFLLLGSLHCEGEDRMCTVSLFAVGQCNMTDLQKDLPLKMPLLWCFWKCRLQLVILKFVRTLRYLKLVLNEIGGKDISIVSWPAPILWSTYFNLKCYVL